jgi:hypothetical protein
MENTEEYWKMKRAKSKEKVKDNKRKFNTKVQHHKYGLNSQGRIC